MSLNKVQKFYIDNNLHLSNRQLAKDLHVEVKLIDNYMKKLTKNSKNTTQDPSPIIITQEPQATPKPYVQKVKMVSNNGGTIMTREASEQADEAYKNRKSTYNVHNLPYIAKCKNENDD
jgi:coenzyme F420-reducing hydrogenase alpha subunit